MRAPNDEMKGKTAVITGSAGGIGLAIARRFAAEGAQVVIVDINGEAAQAAATGIADDGGTALAITCDVGLAADVDRVVEQTLERFGTIDVLVNNAGDVVTLKHFLDGDEQWWDAMIRTNLKGHYLFIDRIAPIMVRAGGGVIINMSSGGATRSHRGAVAYDASKGAIEAMTRSLALELAPYRIRVNALVPGLIATHEAHLVGPAKQKRDETVPLGRGGRPDDLAGPALFLASSDAEYVTGACLVVDGGVLVQQRSPQVEVFGLDRFPRFPDSPDSPDFSGRPGSGLT
jgi:NAD(P)-dependent dehydrogenase (short-subunit alcohol dehydrogenase family)